jgi:hypothetical protein
MRSATTPAYGPSSNVGSVCRATTRPIAVPEPVSSSTSQDWAIICIQVPASEIDWPPKYSR